MSRADFENLIFLEIRGLFPELLSWEDAIRWLRWRGTGMESVDALGDYKSYLDPLIDQAFLRYATTTGAFKTEAQFVLPAGTSTKTIGTAEVPVFSPEIAGWSESTSDRPSWELEKLPSVPAGTMGVPMRGYPPLAWYPVPPVRTVMFYTVAGQQFQIFPTPQSDIKVFLYGKARPYFDAANQLVGVAPELANLVARFVASYLIEPFQPDRAVFWRQEAIQEWNRYAQQHSWEELKSRRSPHNYRTNRLLWRTRW